MKNVRCNHFMLDIKYNFKRTINFLDIQYEKLIDNEFSLIKVDTRIKTDIKL
jgi:hypothetical protein